MNLTQRITAARYGARWVLVNLTWLITVLGTQGMTFGKLAEQSSLITLLLVNAVWLAHVLQGFADKGELAPLPPAALEPPHPLAIANSAGLVIEPAATSSAIPPPV